MFYSYCCLATSEGLDALKDANVSGLLSLWEKGEKPRVSYNLNCDKIFDGEIIEDKPISALEFLKSKGYESIFFEELI